MAKKQTVVDPAQQDLLNPAHRAPVTHEQVVRRHTRTLPGPAPVRDSASLATTMTRFEQGERAKLVAKLRDAAVAAYARLQRPISSNDVRYVLEEAKYEGDPRIMGAVFNGKAWRAVGHVLTNSPLSHPHEIKTFVPRGLAIEGTD